MTYRNSTTLTTTLTWTTCLAALGLVLCLPSVGAAQAASCEQDADCADTERCEAGVVLIECAQEDCPEPPPGSCVDEFYLAECDTDADCGDNLVCLRILMAGCPPFDPECEEPAEMPGFCDEEGSDAVLAATSGLAPTAAASGDGASVPSEAAEAEGSGGDASSSGCSVGAAQAGLGHAAWLALALVGLRRRR